MGLEIERKFLLKDDSWRRSADAGTSIRQGYFERAGDTTCRVRLMGGRGFLTIKGTRHGYTRSEFEYEIPPEDAAAMLEEFCGTRLVEKLRYLVSFEGALWEVDVYSGANAGLFTAEIELESEGAFPVRPPWLGDEVSDDPAYTNGALAIYPYGCWKRN